MFFLIFFFGRKLKAISEAQQLKKEQQTVLETEESDSSQNSEENV